jgi:hypothetical protein
MSQKTFIVTLLKGFSHTSNGTTFYQNRPLKVSLDEMEASRLRSMEGGTKFQVLDEPRDVAKAAVEAPKSDGEKPETTRVPVVDDEDEDEDEDDEDEKPEIDPHLEAMTVAELKDFLDTIGVEYPSNAKKADLIDLAMEHG